MCVFVCPPPRLLITSGVILTSCDWLNEFYSCYMATIVVIVKVTVYQGNNFVGANV